MGKVSNMILLSDIPLMRGIQQWHEERHIVQRHEIEVEQMLVAEEVAEEKGSWSQDHSLHRRCEGEPSRTS